MMESAVREIGTSTTPTDKAPRIWDHDVYDLKNVSRVHNKCLCMQERKWAGVGLTKDENVIHFLIINVPRLHSALHTPINMLTEPLSHKVLA